MNDMPNGNGSGLLKHTPATPIVPKSESTELVKSPSMSLLDDSANHLYALMKGLHANAPEPETRAYDPDRVRAACLCASEIHKLMRLKLDAIRLAKGIK